MSDGQDRTTSPTGEEAEFLALSRTYADIPEPEELKWIITDDGHGTADERGIYIPAYGEGSGRAILIEWSAIDEPLKLLQIVRRLLHKQWFSQKICSGFLDIAFQHFGWSKGCPYL